MKFNENPSIESRTVLRGRTDRHAVANSHFSPFYQHAYGIHINIAQRFTNKTHDASLP
jgi:hypothetical protein